MFIKSLELVGNLLFFGSLLLSVCWLATWVFVNAVSSARGLGELTHKERMKFDPVYKYTLLLFITFEASVIIKLIVEEYGNW